MLKKWLLFLILLNSFQVFAEVIDTIELNYFCSRTIETKKLPQKVEVFSECRQLKSSWLGYFNPAEVWLRLHLIAEETCKAWGSNLGIQHYNLETYEKKNICDGVYFERRNAGVNFSFLLENKRALISDLFNLPKMRPFSLLPTYAYMQVPDLDKTFPIIAQDREIPQKLNYNGDEYCALFEKKLGYLLSDKEFYFLTFDNRSIEKYVFLKTEARVSIYLREGGGRLPKYFFYQLKKGKIFSFFDSFSDTGISKEINFSCKTI